MFVTAFAQLRFAASLVFGVPFPNWVLDRLIDGLRETRREYGEIGADGGEALEGPALDEATGREIQLRRFRRQAARGARETAHYAQLFAALGLDPARLGEDDIARLPITTKEALRDDPRAFVCRTAQPVLRSLTTGTTGRPTAVHFSAYELRLIAALTAMSSLFRGDIGPEDVVHLATSARATLGNGSVMGACAHLGATCALAGLVEPERALALLAREDRVPGKQPRPSILITYPSYLGLLVECGLRRGYGPGDFGLAEISVGGEVVTAGLRERSRALFGPVRITESYALTETAPMGGTPCEEGHLHFDLAHGLLEVLDVETGAAAAPGALGTIVATPFAPFRDTTILLRYDTEDLVRPVAGPLACSLRHLPATTNILGKRRLAARHDAGWTTPRDVLEALESSEAVPLPARCGFRAAGDGVAVEAVARPGLDTPATRRAITDRLAARGVPLRDLRLVDDPQDLRWPLPLRGDLREATFGEAAPHPAECLTPEPLASA